VSWQVQWTKHALRVASRLDRPTRERLLKTVESFAAAGQADVKRLKGTKQETYRLRVGAWRVFFTKETDDAILIRAVRPRGDAY
jgi:mRNA-degrading endonuclease RelE of RelBE toxin-antitoxin system